MFKNKEVRRILFIELIFLFLGFVIIQLVSNYTFRRYQEEIIINNASIVNRLIQVNPSFEETIIETMITHGKNDANSLEILDKYGLANVESIDYLGGNAKIKQDLNRICLWTILPFIFLMFTVFLIFIKRTYKKIGTLSLYTNEILNNRYTMDIREYEEGDISNLKNDLYKMTIKLKEQNELSLKDKQTLADTLSDISHQLKTPLTGMYVINEILYDNQIDEEKRRELLMKNKNQLERIEWLITSLLKMSRIDSGMETLKRVDTKVFDLLNQALTPLAITLELKDTHLHIDCPKDISVCVDPFWTAEALLNIIKNACEHISKSGTISIQCTDNAIYTEIVIKDNGMGIRKEDIGHIFERFYRGSGSKDSIGIGLNMSKKIIDMQDGEISVTSRFGEGATFLIKFYKKVI